MVTWTSKILRSTSWTGIINKDGKVELRKSFETRPNYAQVLIVVDKDANAIFSMNGKASMTASQIDEMAEVVHDAVEKLKVE